MELSLEEGEMNKSQEAVLNRFRYGRFEVFTRNGVVKRLDAKRAKRILKQHPGSFLSIKSTGEVQDAQDQTEVPSNL